jgi:diguanylate cyclase (GGDEF)-like protein
MIENGSGTKLVSFLEKQPKSVILGVSFLIECAIGIIDYFIIIDMYLFAFYLIPVSITTWFVGRRWGIFMAISSAIIWLITAIHSTIYPYLWLSYWNAIIILIFFAIVADLLGMIKLTYEREKKYARIDPLTEIINRRFFLEMLEQEIGRFDRYQHPFTLAYFDLDNFKTVNDWFGHSVGDRLLKLIAQTIQNQVRAVDVFARLGGDEFALLLPETDYESAEVVLFRLQQQVSTIFKDEYLNVSLSIGAITFKKEPLSVDMAIERVDHLMYEVKRHGKDNLKHEIFD